MKTLFIIILLGAALSTTYIDSRDGNEYNVVKISSKKWLKENIKYQISNSEDENSFSVFFKDEPDNGNYYSYTASKEACPKGYHLPRLTEWKTLFNDLSGKQNERQGVLIPKLELEQYGLQLGGLARKDTLLMKSIMGYYWTATDTMKTYYKEPNNGDQKHLIGIHIWSSGEKDSINIEPTYLLARTYESRILMNCKCVKDI